MTTVMPRESHVTAANARVIGATGPTYWLSAALAVVAAAASLLTFTIPAVLRGPAVMNGSARGTALVVLLAGVPVLAWSMLLAARGSAAAVITWLGSVGFLLYNSLMFVFATPANRFFLLYLAMLALGTWSAGTVLRQADVAAFGRLFSRRTPGRGIAVYLWVVVALNAVTWLVRIIPAVAVGGAPGYLAGLLLMAWIAVELLILQRFFFLQPVIAGIGLAEILLAWRWQRVSASSDAARTTRR